MEVLPIEITKDRIGFPWFVLDDEAYADTYNRFICALGEMAKSQKRVVAKDHEVENEKFAMRIFLIRLGFIGDEYKMVRKLLLSRLTGNSSWKNGPPPANPNAEEAP